MGDFTSASLYAIGAYDPSLADCLEYPADLYAKLPAGTSICVAVAHGCDESVLELAELLGIDAWQPAQHQLRAEAIDAAALVRAEFVDEGRVERLRAAGFEFYFMLDPRR